MMDIERIDIFDNSESPVIIAGPCSAESEEQVMSVAS